MVVYDCLSKDLSYDCKKHTLEVETAITFRPSMMMLYFKGLLKLKLHAFEVFLP